MGVFGLKVEEKGLLVWEFGFKVGEWVYWWGGQTVEEWDGGGVGTGGGVGKRQQIRV